MTHALQPRAQSMNIMITLSLHVAQAAAAFLSSICLFTPSVQGALRADLACPFLPFSQHSEVMWWAWRSLKGSRNGSWWHAARVRESDLTAQRTFEFELHRSFSGDRVSAIFRESR